MSKRNSAVHPLALFLPTELRRLLESGWHIIGFHKDSAGYGVHLLRGSAEQVWRFDAKKGHYIKRTVRHKKNYILS
jgi:hypothetical protein